MSQFNPQETGVPDDYSVKGLWYDKQTQFSFSLGKVRPLRKLKDTFFSRNVLIPSFSQTTVWDGGHRNEQGWEVGWGSGTGATLGGRHSLPSWDGWFSVWRARPQQPLRQDCSRKILTYSWALLSPDAMFTRIFWFPHFRLRAPLSHLGGFRIRFILRTFSPGWSLTASGKGFCIWQSRLIRGVWIPVTLKGASFLTLDSSCFFYKTDFLVQDINTFLPSYKILIHLLRNPSSSDY